MPAFGARPHTARIWCVGKNSEYKAGAQPAVQHAALIILSNQGLTVHSENQTATFIKQ